MSLINYLKHSYHRIFFLLNPRSSKVFQWVPFNIKKPLPSGAINEMIKILNCLSGHAHVRPSDGTLLGILRDKQLIKHDNDLDFDVIHTDDSVKVIRRLFSNSKFKKCREVLFSGKVQQLTYYDDAEIVYDFIFWFMDGKFGLNFSEPGYLRIMPSEFILDLSYIEIENYRVPVPKNANEWLNYRYGSLWMVPHEEKGDWRLDCGDLVKLWGWK